MAQELDLTTIFSAVAKTLGENENSLNAMDSYNHDHGTNMVDTFKLVKQAVAKKQAKPVADQLAYASQVLRKKSTSGSAKVYADGLENAASQFVGKSLNAQTIGTLINTMMGSQAPAANSGSTGSGDLMGSLIGSLMGSQQSGSGSGDMLSSLLGSLTGGGSTASQPQSGGSGMLGSLLGGLTGAQQNDNDGLDMGDLLSAGMAFFAAKKEGGSNMDAIMQALSASSPLGQRDDRKQSGALIINSILSMLGKQK